MKISYILDLVEVYINRNYFTYLRIMWKWGRVCQRQCLITRDWCTFLYTPQQFQLDVVNSGNCWVCGKGRMFTKYLFTKYVESMWVIYCDLGGTFPVSPCRLPLFILKIVYTIFLSKLHSIILNCPIFRSIQGWPPV